MSLSRMFGAAVLSLAAAGLLVSCTSTANQASRAADSENRVLSQTADRKIVQLDNGLIVIAQRLQAAPVASVQCWVKTGSIFERQYNGSGISHFLEHLVSGGTTTSRTEEESNRILGRIGAQTNAGTSLDTVSYYVNTSAENAEIAIDLVSDWMQNSIITQEEFDRERDVIQREFDMGRGEPGRIFWKLTQQARYSLHPARHPTIGYLDEFLKITRDDVYDFYKQMYVPNNMVFVVTGDVDPARVVDQVQRLWAASEAANVPPVLFPVEPAIERPREMTGHADIDRPRLRLAWPGTRLGADHDYALDLLAQVLGQGELSRLVQSVRNQQRLVTSVDAYNLSFAWGEGFFGIDAVVERDKLDETRQAILAEVQRIQTLGVQDDELDRAKRKTIAAVVYSAQTAQALASRMASDFISTADPDYLDYYATAIQKLTVADLQAAAQRFLVPQRMITVRLLPHDAKPEELTRPPDEPLPAGLRADVELIDLDNAGLVRRMTERHRAQAQMTRSAEMGPQRLIRLDNGLRVLLQRNTRLPIVAMQWYHLGGLLADETGREGVANAMAEMMIKGAGDRSAEDIARRLEELGAQLHSACGNSTIFVNAQSLAADWKDVLALMADVIQRPNFPADEWDKLQPRLLAAIDSQNDQWHAQLRNAMRELYFADHPWSQPTVGRREVVAALTTENLRQFHASRVGAADGVLAIMGDFDEKAVLEQVRQLFASMPAQPAVAFQPPAQTQPSTTIRQVQTPKPLAAVQIAYGPGMARNNDDYPAMLVMDKVLSNFPVGWLEQELRGRGPGLVYAVGSGIFTGVSPGYWAAVFNTQADSVPEAMSRTLQVVDRIRTELIDEATLERARTAVIVGEAFGRQSNSQRATNAALDELYGLGHDESERFIRHIRAVTSDQVRAVAQKYLRNPMAVILTNQPVDEATLPPLEAAVVR